MYYLFPVLLLLLLCCDTYSQRIDAGDLHNLVICEDGSVWTWGTNVYGQLGIGTTSNGYYANPLPVQVPGISDINMVAAGNDHSLAVESTGTLWAWGGNTNGSLGDGTIQQRLSPVQIGFTEGIIKIDAGQFFSIVLAEDSSVWTWGANNYGQLGDSTSIDRYTPVKVIIPKKIIDVDAGIYHCCALDDQGFVWAWGDNFNGQLGNGSIGQSGPNPVPGKTNLLTNVVDVAAGYSHSLALKNDGTVWAWGNNQGAQLGDGTILNRKEPVQVKNLNNIVKIATRASHSIALQGNGDIWMWGSNDFGQLGNDTMFQGTYIRKPIKVPGMTGIDEITVGDYFTMVLGNDERVWTWGGGYLQLGQLGDGDSVNRDHPQAIMNLNSCSLISSNTFESIAYRNVCISPNPANNRIHIKYNINESLLLDIFNINGIKFIRNMVFNGNAMIDISEFENGLYIICLKGSNSLISKKFMVMK